MAKIKILPSNKAIFEVAGEVDVQSVIASSDRLFFIKQHDGQPVNFGDMLQYYIGRKVKMLVIIKELNNDEYSQVVQELKKDKENE